MDRMVQAKLRTDLELSGIIQQLERKGYRKVYQDETGWWHTDGAINLYEIAYKAQFSFYEFADVEFIEPLKPPFGQGTRWD